ncbi:metal ABC transporter solute-binding protein, Zn/Mn family [Enhydrobacter aerosaccus]|nr:zinc ABC transporter substrate-binding protein [Enhydrobacter aerosaccus]
MRAFLFVLLVLAALPASAQPKLKVISTFSILGDFVAQVGGDRVEDGVIVGPDTDVHTYQPTPIDARRLAAAQVLVSNGLGFEGWLDRLAEAASFKGRRIIASQGTTTTLDPHCWQDVGCARRYVANITEGLTAADPANAAFYRAHAADYDQRLAALDTWIRSEIAKVPPERRKVITGHNAFQYFARAYGVRFEAARGYNTDSEPTARDIAGLIRDVRAQHIKALFVENLTNPALIDQVAHDAGVHVGPALYSDALSRPDGPAPTYEAMMRYNVTALVVGMMKN